MYRALFLLLIFCANLDIADAARIRNRKVKEAPKTCSHLNEDSYLSREDKKVLGTKRHSLIIEQSEGDETVSLIKDKGEKICQWKTKDWIDISNYKDVNDFKFYIDEYKGALYPYFKDESTDSYRMRKISLNDCVIGEVEELKQFKLPKCEKPKRSIRSRSKAKRVASK